MRVCRVVADVPAIEREFDYLVPDDLAARVAVGTIVRVRLHGRRVRAWVTADDVASEVDPARLQPIASVSGEGPPAEVLDLCRWTARRFVGSPVALYRSASPANNIAVGSVGARQAMVVGADIEPVDREAAEVVARLTDSRSRVVWWPPARDRRAVVHALLARDGSSLVITADPSRADALVATLRRLGWPAVAWHSDLPAPARTDAWRRCARGGVVVVGGRTAAFAPIPDLRAAVVVDDLDEALQEERQPTWHALDVLAERCARVEAPMTVVSALPSVRSLARAEEVVAPSPSVVAAGWPRIEIVDLGDEPPGTGLLSGARADALRAAVGHGRSAVCLLNRRGRARLLYCTACRSLSRWDRDGSPLLDLDSARELVAIGARPTVCLHCGTPKPRLLSAGVQRLRDDIAALLGGAVVVAAVDAATDTIDPAAAVLVGTESLLHRIEVRRRHPGLVAVLDLDQELLASRLRAEEQALWLVARAAGLLAARPRRETMLLLQTHAPEHPAVRALVAHDLESTQRADADERRKRRLPPYVAAALLTGEAAAVDAAVAGLALIAAGSVTIKGPTGEGTKRRALVEHADADDLAAMLHDVAAAARTAGRLRIEVEPARA